MKKYNDGATRSRKKFDDIFAVWIQIQYSNVTAGQTDRLTPDDSKDRAYA